MRTRQRLCLTALTTVAVLAAFTATALGNRIKFTPFPGTFTAIWRPLNFRLAGSFATVSCNVTLGGSIHIQTIPKTNGLLLGRDTTATVESCSGGTATILNEALPIHWRYGGYKGTLPNVNTIWIPAIGMAMSIHPTGFIECLVTSEASEPVVLGLELDEEGRVTGIRADETRPIGPGGFACSYPGPLTLSGTGTLTTGGGGTVTERLI